MRTACYNKSNTAFSEEGSLLYWYTIGQTLTQQERAPAPEQPAPAARPAQKAAPKRPAPKKKPNTGDKVARAAGKQLGSLGKMFGSFKDEFDKASKGE